VWLVGRWFGPDVVQRVVATVAEEPAISRRELSRRVCDWLGWRSPNGRRCELAGRKALAELERRGQVQLPAAAQVRSFRQPRARAAPPAVATIRGELTELGEIDIVPVASRYSELSRVWNGLLETYHYLGRGPLCGAQIRYVVRSARYGWVGALSFSGATFRLATRDHWIGWSDQARRANLAKVVNNSRFLIVPSVAVPNLASHVLGRSLARLATDWQARYGYEPVLVETFVDGQRYAGTCYRAANWQYLGDTAGRADGFANGKVATGKKAIFVRPLRADWQTILGQAPLDRLAIRPRAGGPSDWVEEEFASARIFDARTRRRLYVVATDLGTQPGVPIPQACGGSKVKSKAAYRLFQNERLDLAAVLMGHREATARRVAQHAVVLAVQDTTTLNYTAHPATADVGPINTTTDQAVGLIVHDTLAFSVEGTPLGLVDLQCWARDPAQAGQRETRKRRPIEDKESNKWLKSYRAVAELQSLCPSTLLVSVADREGDIHELFHEALHTPEGPKLLVRSERSRLRKVEEDLLWTTLPAVPVAGQFEVLVPRRSTRPARTAQLEVRHAAVTLRPPKDSLLTAVPIWAVYAREVAAGLEGTEPLEWMLLTTVAVASLADALERLRWYTLRWGIEVYHRTLKSACHVEDRKLSAAGRLETCLAIDLVVAWRIFALAKQGRETPNVPCDLFLAEEEWKVLHAAVHHEPPPATPPSLREAVRMIGALGGHLASKRYPDPGTITLWRGLLRLEALVEGCRLAQLLYRPRDGP
jgi:hypothetical protein